MMSSRSNKKYVIPIVGILLVALVVFTIVWMRKARTDTNDSALGVVKRMDLVQRVTISGQIWPKKRLDIKPPYNGYVIKLFVKTGDHLKAGDPVVTFSPSLSGNESNFPIRTGFAGTVTQVLKTEGEYITEAGDQNLVARVEDLSELYVLSTVPELDVAKIKVGLDAVVKVSALVGETFDGVIKEIGLSAKDKDRWSSSSTEFQVKVALKTHDPRLFPGMSAVMDVITDKRDNVLALPHEFIQEENNHYFVTTDSREKKTVTLGLQTSEAAEILTGVKEGEKVKPIDFLSLPKTED
jgi:multidrug efflux pump subunit AcrA (membrane-fusion protein)